MVASGTHENALIEELEALAKWTAEQRMEWVRDARRNPGFARHSYGKASSYSAVETHIRERIATLRAQRAPVRYTEG